MRIKATQSGRCPYYSRKTPMIPWHNWGWFGGQHCLGCGYRPRSSKGES